MTFAVLNWRLLKWGETEVSVVSIYMWELPAHVAEDVEISTILNAVFLMLSYSLNKYVRLWGRTYIHTCRSYVRTPHDFTNGASLAWRLPAHLHGNVYMRVGVARALADSSDFWLLREQSSQKWEIPCFVRRWTAMQNLTLLALSSSEKSMTIRTQKLNQKQTVTDISTPYLSACVDNKDLYYHCNFGLMLLSIYSCMVNIWLHLLLSFMLFREATKMGFS